MSKPVGRLSDSRERIMWESQRLENRDKELKSKMEGLKAYIGQLEGFQNEVRQVTSKVQLSAIMRRGKLETRIRPGLFKLSRYLVEKEVEQKLGEVKREFDKVLQEIEAVKRLKKDVNICPDCYGQGQLRKVNYVREDGLIHPVLHVTSCPLCGGKGRID